MEALTKLPPESTPKAKIDTKAMLDDARGRDAAWLTLLLATDRQAIELFRIYMTLGIAVSSGLAAGLAKQVLGHEIYPIVALGSMLLCLFAACIYCLKAMRPIEISLPGRTGKFWQWAMRDDITEQAALSAYFDYAQTAQDMNSKVNSRNSSDLNIAKKLGIAAFAVAAMIMLVGWQAP
ncbi:hypothetical protein [Mesorhizobium amorphae]|uniref:hypothetical protein n=1 Tax=Mesorhizobium amorphae TaxID=71433 RepID=UPI00177EB2ED|nr:hypothetical protein [Mesorhizobium amorphae]